MLPATRAHIQLAPRFLKDFAHLRHALFGFLGRDEARAVLILQLRELAHFLADLHRTEFRSEEHTSELQSLMRISYDVFCLKTKTTKQHYTIIYRRHKFS